MRWQRHVRRLITQLCVIALATIVLAGSLAVGLDAMSPMGRVYVSQAETLASPLLYGTNMSLFNANDQIVTNPATQGLLRERGMSIIRVPTRYELSDETELAALRAVKDIGAAPLVILHGVVDKNMLSDDERLLSLVQSVFGAGPAYIEFGNEEDLAGVDVTLYTEAWNQVVPQLKTLAPTYKFIGPVTYSYDPAYVATFDQNANPRPDYNSWHEYVCNTGNTDTYCMDHIDNWNTHIQLTNEAVRAAIGTTLPFIISEWNLDPEQDPRYSDTAFIQQWTAKALQTLEANASNGLFAAMQYCATNNGGFNLIDGQNNLTPQGEVFFQSLSAALGTPTSVPTDTASATATPSETVTPSAVANTLEDTFTRPDQVGWGTSVNPDGAPPVTWGLDANGAKSYVKIVSNTGVYGYQGSINTIGIASAGSATYNGGDSLVEFSLSAVGHATPYVVQNACADKSCYYGARLHTSQNKLEIARDDHGHMRILIAATFVATANTKYWMRLDVTPGLTTTLRAKIWVVGSPEPAAWILTATDTQPLAANLSGLGATWDAPGKSESIQYAYYAYRASGLATPTSESTISPFNLINVE